MADLPRLELRCLGSPGASLDGREPPREVTWQRHLALLIYLALSPERTRTRDHLVGLLWPEKPEKDARAALKQSVYRLRQFLGADRLQSHETSVTLNDAGLDVDALQFNSLAESDPSGAVALLRGDFLEGFLLDEAPAFEEWVTVERSRRRARAVAVLVAHGEKLLTASRFVDASDAAQRALALEPHTELAVRVLMRAAALQGDSAGALAAYHAFATRLAEVVKEAPSRALVALSERIRHQRTRPLAPEAAIAESPLVGRDQIHQEAFELLRAGLAGGPRTLMITAAPGMGATRLLGECTRRLTLEGAVVAFARPLPSDHDAPWSTLRLLLRSGLGAAPGLVAADAASLGLLAWLAPELRERAQPVEPRDAAQVAGALAAALRAIAEESPVGLVIDDAQLCDGASLEALRAALLQVEATPILLAVAAAEGAETVRGELLRLRSEVGRGLRGMTVGLAPLGLEDVNVLVGAMAPWCKDDSERERLSRRLTVETGGNPFFIVTLLEGLRRLATMREDFFAWPKQGATIDTPLPFSVPNLARLAIAARVAELDQESRRVLSVASIGGLALDLDLIATLAEVPVQGIEDRLAAAERRHLIVFDGERYAFTAPLIGEVVRGECLTSGQRKSLRQRAIAVLAARTDLEARVLRAELWAAVDPGAGALEGALEVAEAAIEAGSLRTARRALRAAEAAGGGPRVDVLRGRLDQPTA